ncbi:hypothetical protein AHAS_Ahas03G0233200 [Arachis hypogaea]
MEGGGTALSDVYQSAKKLLLKTRDGVERLKRFDYSASSDLSFSLSDLSLSLCVQMDRFWHSSLPSTRPLEKYSLFLFFCKWLCCEFWCRKVEQIVEEADSLKQPLDKYNIKNQKWIKEAKERAEILGRAVCTSIFIMLWFW